MVGELRKGFVACLPLSTSVAAYGSVLGVLAAQKGLHWTTLLLMDVSVFAGSAQFVLVEMWRDALPIVEMVVAAAIINLRYMLIGASLSGLLGGRPLWQRALIMHFVADENWAVTVAADRKGLASPGFLLGGGFCMMLCWTTGTLSGIWLGAIIPDPEVLALDYAFTAVFTALVVGLWRGKRDLAPWIVAAGLAIVFEWLLPGKWYILVGGVGGALAAALLPAPAEAETRPPDDRMGPEPWDGDDTATKSRREVTA